MMKTGLLVRTILVTSTVFAAAGLSRAQDASKPQQKQTGASRQKTVSKTRKVWTDDDLSVLHRSSVVSVAQAHPETETPTAHTATEPAASPSSEKPNAKSSGPKGPDALAHPKTVADADKMIAWEQRDIDSQQEFVDRLQAELDQAPPDQKERLQKSLSERQQYLADTRQEQQGLIAQRKLLDKKSTGDTSTASSQPPQ